MKKLLLTILTLVFATMFAHGAGVKISDLVSAISLTNTDVFPVVINTDTTPATRKATIALLLAHLGVSNKMDNLDGLATNPVFYANQTTNPILSLNAVVGNVSDTFVVKNAFGGKLFAVRSNAMITLADQVGIKRVSTRIEFKLADDSAFAALKVRELILSDIVGSTQAVVYAEGQQTFGFRSGGAATTNRIYEIYADDANYSRMKVAYDGVPSLFVIDTEAEGAYPIRELQIGAGGTNAINVSTDGYVYDLTVSNLTVVGTTSVPDEAYGAGWDSSLGIPTKNALYDKIETLSGGGGGGSGAETNANNFEILLYDDFSGYDDGAITVLDKSSGSSSNGIALNCEIITVDDIRGQSDKRLLMNTNSQFAIPMHWNSAWHQVKMALVLTVATNVSTFSNRYFFGLCSGINQTILDSTGSFLGSGVPAGTWPNGATFTAGSGTLRSNYNNGLGIDQYVTQTNGVQTSLGTGTGSAGEYWAAQSNHCAIYYLAITKPLVASPSTAGAWALNAGHGKSGSAGTSYEWHQTGQGVIDSLMDRKLSSGIAGNQAGWLGNNLGSTSWHETFGELNTVNFNWGGVNADIKLQVSAVIVYRVY